MTRFENFCVQCLLGILLLAVVTGCGPGSGGTGTGPITGAVPLSNSGPSGILTGVNFVSNDVTGVWADSAGTVVTLTTESIAVRQGCNSFSFSGTWGNTVGDLAQVQGSYTQLPGTANNNVARNEPAIFRLSVPTTGRIAIEIVDAQNGQILRVDSLTQAPVTSTPSACR